MVESYIHLICVNLCSSAQKENLLCEEEDPRDSRNVVYCGYCSTHYKKMVSALAIGVPIYWQRRKECLLLLGTLPLPLISCYTSSLKFN